MGDPPFAGFDWQKVFAALSVAAGGGGLLALLGRVADRAFPTADARLADQGSRRKERTDRINELEDDLEKRTQDWIAAERRTLELRSEYEQKLSDLRQHYEEVISQKQTDLLATTAQLELLRAKLGVPLIPRERLDAPTKPEARQPP